MVERLIRIKYCVWIIVLLLFVFGSGNGHISTGSFIGAMPCRYGMIYDMAQWCLAWYDITLTIALKTISRARAAA